MGNQLAAIYFKPNGDPNLKRLTLITGVFVLAYYNTFNKTIKYTKDNTMAPFMKSAGFPFSDVILYKTYSNPKEHMQGKIVALRNPFKHNDILIRRVIAEQNQWVQRVDDGGIIRIPNGHIWVECENMNNSTDDSLTTFDGPISRQFLIGECKYIVWPLWRLTSFHDLYKYSALITGKIPHSAVYNSDDIYHMYGIQ